MKIKWIVFTTIVLIGTSQAEQLPLYPLPQMPPKFWDHKPIIPVIEYILPYSEVNLICQEKTKYYYNGHMLRGCATVKDGTCYVWRINYELTRRHEMGHCNGWPPNHPKDSPVSVPISHPSDTPYSKPNPWPIPDIKINYDTLNEALKHTNQRDR